MLIIRNVSLLRGQDTKPAPNRSSDSIDKPEGFGARAASQGHEILHKLVIDQGRIVSLDREGQGEPIEPPQFDAQGLIATQGWLDIQLNGGFGHDFTEEPTSIWDVAARLPALGLTAFLPTIISSPLEKVQRAIAVFEQGPPQGWKGAIPLGLHLEGPFLNPEKRGAHNPAHLRPPDPAIAKTWSRRRGVYLVTLAPELPDAPETARILRENGVIVSAGHTLADFNQALQAFNAGITCVTHLFNAQPPLNHRQPGLVGAALQRTDIFAGIIADGIHVHPAMVEVAWKCTRDHLFLVTDAIAALGMPEGNYTIGDYHVIVDKTGVHLPDGTLAGSNATPELCIHNLAAWTGCSITEAAKAMSEAPAAFLGLGEKGINPGAAADLTLIDPDGKVAATIVAGEMLFDRGREA